MQVVTFTSFEHSEKKQNIFTDIDVNNFFLFLPIFLQSPFSFRSETENFYFRYF